MSYNLKYSIKYIEVPCLVGTGLLINYSCMIYPNNLCSSHFFLTYRYIQITSIFLDVSFGICIKYWMIMITIIITSFVWLNTCRLELIFHKQISTAKLIVKYTRAVETFNCYLFAIKQGQSPNIADILPREILCCPLSRCQTSSSVSVYILVFCITAVRPRIKKRKNVL